MHGGVRISFMHFRFCLVGKLNSCIMAFKGDVARIGVYRVNALTKLG